MGTQSVPRPGTMAVLIALLFVAACVAQNTIPTDISIQGRIPDSCVSSTFPGSKRSGCTTPRTFLFPAISVVIPSRAFDSFDGATNYPADYILKVTSISGQSLENLQFALSAEQTGNAGAGCGATVAAIPLSKEVIGVGADAKTEYYLRLRPEWVTRPLELEPTPRFLCIASTIGVPNFSWTGLLVDTVWNCAADTATDDTMKCKSWLTDFTKSTEPDKPTLTALELAMLDGRKKCCRTESTKLSRWVVGTPFAEAAPIAAGRCINEKVLTCCGTSGFDKFTEKCCTASPVGTQRIGGPCPCRSNGTVSTSCPVGESCCLPTKFPELIPTTSTGEVSPTVVNGECFNPTQFKCCDTGKRYDPGSQQCCTLTGIQPYVVNNVDSPCPCNANTDCRGGTLCCKQTAPEPAVIARCDIYQNYIFAPLRDDAVRSVACSGRCIDPQFQLCCNGKTCRKEYEKCCNATCCNKFTGTCMEGFVEGTALNPELHNPLDFRVKRDTCSEIEQLDTVKSFWIFVLPTVLLIASFTSLAVVLVFANKSTNRSFSLIERSLMIVAVLALFVALPLFFSPVYKYGVVVVLVALFTIVTAAAPVKALNVADIIVLVVALIYLFDPFFGNAFLTLASDRQLTGLEDEATSGILHATNRLWRESRYCTAWYNYFKYDLGLQDVDRVDNFLSRVPAVVPRVDRNIDVSWGSKFGNSNPLPLQAFGYCSRSWITALEFFEGFILIFTLLLFILSLVAVILRFKSENSYDPIELEVQQGPVILQ